MAKGQSRDINNLNWKAKEVYLELEKRCKEQGVKTVVFETTRTTEYQEILYSYGRTDKSKQIVTNLRAPTFHREGVGLAFDLYVEVNGKAIWDANHPHWKIVLKIAKELGLTCGNDWKMRDTCHFQLDGGLKNKDILDGKRPSWFIKPTQTKSPTQILFYKRIISTLEWNDWLNKEQYIQSEYMKSLIINFYLFFSGEKDFLKAVNYISDKKLISDKAWWLDKLSRPQEIESKWCKILVDRMSCFIDSRGENC